MSSSIKCPSLERSFTAAHAILPFSEKTQCKRTTSQWTSKPSSWSAKNCSFQPQGEEKWHEWHPSNQLWKQSKTGSQSLTFSLPGLSFFQMSEVLTSRLLFAPLPSLFFSDRQLCNFANRLNQVYAYFSKKEEGQTQLYFAWHGIVALVKNFFKLQQHKKKKEIGVTTKLEWEFISSQQVHIWSKHSPYRLPSSRKW